MRLLLDLFPRKERLLKQQAPETDRREQRPSAEEWAGLEHLQAPKASAAEWLAQQIPETLPKTLKQLQTVVGCCDVAGSRAESSGKRTRPHNDASLKDHDDNDGVEGVLLPVCSTGKRACFSLCEARAKRKGGANEDDALVEDSEDVPWPKLDISRQFFSSKEEPMILGDDPLAQVMRMQLDCWAVAMGCLQIFLCCAIMLGVSTGGPRMNLCSDLRPVFRRFRPMWPNICATISDMAWNFCTRNIAQTPVTKTPHPATRYAPCTMHWLTLMLFFFDRTPFSFYMIFRRHSRRRHGPRQDGANSSTAHCSAEQILHPARCRR